MKIEQYTIIFFVVSLLIISCEKRPAPKKSINEQKGSAVADTAQYRMDVFDKKLGSPDSSGEDLLSVYLKHPVFTSLTNEAFQDSLNLFVTDQILSAFQENSKIYSNDDLFNQLKTDYESLRKEFPDYTHSWILKRSIDVVYNTPPLLCLCFDELLFTGGAHPNYVQNYYNFDTESGKIMTLDDLVSAENKDSLTALAEKKFREIKNINSCVDLDQAGYWFENNLFSLTDNFAITKDGLLFFYNSYEIAPYALGTTKLELPYEKIRYLLNKDIISL